MNRDSFNRRIDYLRFSVTTACNYSCLFCSPFNYGRMNTSDTDLSDVDVLNVVRAASQIGFKKIRLTGGEPLLRPGIVELTGKIRRIKGIEEVVVTTNGSLLVEHSRSLQEVGIKRININIPSLDEMKYKSLTNTNLLQKVITGIEMARKLGIDIKINIVATNELTEGDVVAFSRFAKEFGLQLRFIEYMPLSFNPSIQALSIVTLKSWMVNHGICADVIAPMYRPFCCTCNRLRISSSGEVFPCLFDSPSHYLKPVIKEEAAIKKVLIEAIGLKPQSYYYTNVEESYHPAIRKVGG